MNVLYKKLSFQFCIQKSFYIDDDGAAFQSKAQFQGHICIYKRCWIKTHYILIRVLLFTVQVKEMQIKEQIGSFTRFI
jgi:hypothetical protein